MESFEVNKLIGALLGTVFVVFSITLVAGALFDTHAPETPGYAIEAAEPGEGGAAPAEEAAVPIATLLQDADPASGESIFRKCQACHTGEQGGANKVGPNLWNIVNRPIASHEGFSYSAAMKEFAGTAGDWTYEHLNTFLTKPKAAVKGTAMGFIGLPKPKDRADLLAYLRTLSDSPAPLPEAPAAEETSAQAPAEGDAAAKPAEGGDTAAKPADAAAEAPAEDEAEKPAD